VQAEKSIKKCESKKLEKTMSLFKKSGVFLSHVRVKRAKKGSKSVEKITRTVV